ncbi:Flp family type IVb pilin [Vibrio paucivorans]|uniref:Flp family type IVb pilin n=1 Tax=Vibrio paucivorans TaxID=2829489 RepID=A0A9X3CFK3_9VIBR|nr:Flp family type IVb pilin [Vibrio paucivorans]MCW8334559.1 Flp family type IVb pilin [Vibrio paucivorans]
MKYFLNQSCGFWRDQEGLTVVEYVVGAGFLVIVVSAVFSTSASTLIAEIGTFFSS